MYPDTVNLAARIINLCRNASGEEFQQSGNLSAGAKTRQFGATAFSLVRRFRSYSHRVRSRRDSRRNEKSNEPLRRRRGRRWRRRRRGRGTEIGCFDSTLVSLLPEEELIVSPLVFTNCTIIGRLVGILLKIFVTGWNNWLVCLNVHRRVFWRLLLGKERFLVESLNS